MRFILVNGRTPRPHSLCVLCCRPNTDLSSSLTKAGASRTYQHSSQSGLRSHYHQHSNRIICARGGVKQRPGNCDAKIPAYLSCCQLGIEKLTPKVLAIVG